MPGSTSEDGASWRSAGELVDADSQLPTVSGQGLDDDRLDASEFLRSGLVVRCANVAEVGAGDGFVRELVSDLYADGVDPGTATDALVMAGCGGPDVIVRELVAQGGDTAVLPVVDRAIALQGPASSGRAEKAAAQGLRRWRRATGLDAAHVSGPLVGSSLSTAMIYFTLGGDGDPVQRSSSLAQRLGTAAPGYGIYTYVLYGADAGGAEPANIDTYLELLRVIETYVLAAVGEIVGPDRQAHSFLVPVHADRRGATLLERTGPELSARMRADFSAYLRAGGQLELAQRFSQGTGPFLVSSLEPRLVPADQRASRMLVDLGDIGPEYMYSVVDAYDRLIPSEQVGRVDSLAAIRTRLIEMFPDRAIDAAAAPPPAGGWVFLFGRPQRAGVAGRQTLGARVASSSQVRRGSPALVAR
ncbi:MAG: hypothetical protein WBG92_04555 [Thiohalocapsa sp.]